MSDPQSQAVLGALLALVLFTQAGLLLVRVALPGRLLSKAETAALSFILGVGLVTSEMLAFGIARVRFSLAALIAPWLVGWVALAWGRSTGRLRSDTSPAGPVRERRLTLTNTLVLAGLAVLLGLLSYRSTLQPVFLWDAIAYWDLKARAFFIDGGIQPFVTDRYYDWAHLDYPQLVPLSGALVYFCIGQPHEVVQAVPVAFFAALLALFHGVLRREGAERSLALALTVGLALMPNVLFWAYNFQGESALACYTFASVAFFYLYLRDRSFPFLLLSAVCGGFLTQTKIEGPFFVVPAVVLLAARAARRRDPATTRDLLIYLGLVGGVALPWQVFQRVSRSGYEGFVSVSVAASLQEHLALVPGVLRAIAKWALTPSLGAMGLVFLLLVVCLVARARPAVRSRGHQYLLGFLAFSLVPYVMLWIALPRYLEPLALDRLLLVFTVGTFFLVAVHLVACRPDVRWRRSHLGVAAAALLVGLAGSQTSWLGGTPAGGGTTWRMPDGAARWRVARNSCELTPSGGSLLVRSRHGSACVVDLGATSLDPAARATWTMIARGVAGSRTSIELRWRTRDEGSFTVEKRASMRVAWDGSDQRIELEPDWKGVPDYLRVALGSDESRPSPLLIRRVEIRPRPSARIADFLEGAGQRSGVAFALAAAVAALAWRMHAARVVATLALVWPGLAALCWIIPDLWLGPPRGQVSRPVSLARETLRMGAVYGAATPLERMERIESEIGKADLGKCLTGLIGSCHSGDVALLVHPWNEEETDPNRLNLGVEQLYTVLRLTQRLYPWKVIVVTQPAELTRLLRTGVVSRVVGFERAVPIEIRADTVHRGLWWAACPRRPVAAGARPPSPFPPAANRPTGRTRIGVFDAAEGRWELVRSRPRGAPTITLQFGRGGDIPVSGDWDGDGVDTVGVYRVEEQRFELRNANRPGARAVSVRFGREGDLPVAGDWDGDRIDEIGVYRPSEAAFYLGGKTTGPQPPARVALGAPGDLPVVGDWDGDGVDEPAVYRQASGTFLLPVRTSAGIEEVRTVPFGKPGDRPVAGDWDGDGVDSIGVYRPSERLWLLTDSNQSPPASIVPAHHGWPGSVPVCGRWQGSPWWAME